MNIEKFSELENNIGYHFKDKRYLIHAFTHSSYANEKTDYQENYERLEFLGDAVLELIISDYLFEAYPKKNEGELTKYRSSLVCEHTLSMCARDISLGEYLLLSRGEMATGGNDRNSILCDIFESLLGAIYLDGGFEPAKEYVHKYLLNDVEAKTLFYDAKTILQEIVQASSKKFLEYKLIKESGPDHCKEFTVAANIDNEQISTGVGRTKKSAEQMAAYKAILKLKKNNKE